ncbi:hypothetical protein HK104_005086, partial [Borealophlyctis nickersoniae]
SARALSSAKWEEAVKEMRSIIDSARVSNLLGLTLEASIAVKEECVILWECLDNVCADVEDLSNTVKELRSQVDGLFMDRVRLTCRLIGTNIPHKLARLCLSNVSVSQARGMNLKNLQAKKGVNAAKLAAYLAAYPGAVSGMEFLATDNLIVAHPESMVKTDGTSEPFTEYILAKCLEERYKDHMMEEEVKDALALLKHLGKELNEDLIVPF